MPRIVRSLVRPMLAVAATVACLTFVRATPVLAVDGLEVTSATTYVVDPTNGAVHVLTDLAFTNTTVDEADLGVIRRRYFTAFTFPVPVGAADEVASALDGTPLTVTADYIAGNTSFFLYTVEFPRSLYAGETLSLSVRYDIAGLPPRSSDPSRVNAAYAAFTAYGVGDPGRASLRVEVPPGYQIDTLGSDASVTTENGVTIYTADAIAQPDQYALFVSARNDDALVTTPATTPDGATFEIKSWPGDDEWRAFVEGQLTIGVPALSDLIGMPWPVDDTVEVRQAVTPYLYGYAGWFSAADDELEIGEDLDAEVVLHELSHAWFNTTWFDDRWVNEGLAQVYSSAAAAGEGVAATVPAEPVDDDPAAVDLLVWGAPDFEQGADDTEASGYNASFHVMDSVVDQIGFDGMRRVLDAVDADTIAYLGDLPAESDDASTTDWRRLLDLVDELGVQELGTAEPGSWTATSLFDDLVVTDVERPELTARTIARAAYAQLEQRGGDWAPPLTVRRAMADWRFDDALETMAAADALLTIRDELATTAAALGVDLAGVDEAAYEATDDLGVTSERFDQRLATAALVLSAAERVEAQPGVIDRIGLVGDEPADDVARAATAFAAGDDATAADAARRAIDTLDEAGARGALRTAVVVVTLLGGAALVGWARARRRNSAARADQAADT